LEIELPDGTILDAPDDANPSVVAKAYLSKNAQKPVQDKYSPTEGMSTGQRLLAGAGKAFSDLGLGARQVEATVRSAADKAVNFLAPNQGSVWDQEKQTLAQEVANRRGTDAPLMQTGAGKVGNFVGNVAATVPAAFVPGANTVAGAGLVGGALGALQPTTSDRERLINTGVGGAVGAGAQYVGGKLASAVSNKLAERQVTSQASAAINAERDAVLQRSRDAGLVIPPTAVNDSATATAMESIAGKFAAKHEAQAQNARTISALIGEDLGLPANQPLTRGSVQGVIKEAGKAYGAVSQFGKLAPDAQFAADIQAIAQVGTDLEKAAPGIGASANDKVQGLVGALSNIDADGKQAVGLFRYLNEQAKANYKSAFQQGGNQQALELARAQSRAADAVGGLIERNLQSAGQGQLAADWQAARVTIAKAYTALNALKGQFIDGGRYAAALRKDVPLTGGARVVAEFADHFGDYAKVPKGGVGVSKLGAVVAGGGLLGGIATGNPAIAVGGVAAPAVSYGVRKGIMTGIGQNMLATPSYAPGMLGTGMLNSLQLLGRYGAIPAVGATNALMQSSQ
jgi:hypothetical protein